jgi:hypothetical protein
MSEFGIRVANRTGSQANGILSLRPVASGNFRPLWPFTVRSNGQSRPVAEKSHNGKPSLNFTT